MGESGALHVFKSSNSSAVKAAVQESGEAVQGTLTAALMAKVDFQQLTSPQNRYQLEVWGSLLVSFFCDHSSLLLQAKQGSHPRRQPGA